MPQKRFVRSVLAQDVSIAASTVYTYNLPVNPVSHILYTLKFLNDTGTITDYLLFARALLQVTRVEVLYKGQAIISASLFDMGMLSQYLTKKPAFGCNFVKTNNDVRSITVMIPLTRFPYSYDECFPATRSGELQFQVTVGAAVTGMDTLIHQIETCELLDAEPSQFIKATTLTRTPTATGYSDVDLPIGNDILAILGYGTTVPTGASYNASLGQIQVLLDNVQYGYSLANWESMHGEILQMLGGYPELAEHTHRGNFTTTVEGDTGFQQYDDTWLQNFIVLEYDPMRDGSYAIETAGHARCNLSVNQEPTADAQRFIPVELVKLGG